jgi:hypothetical protein
MKRRQQKSGANPKLKKSPKEERCRERTCISKQSPK